MFLPPPVFMDEDGPFLVYPKARAIHTGPPTPYRGEEPLVVDANDAAIIEAIWAADYDAVMARSIAERAGHEDAQAIERQAESVLLESVMMAIAERLGVDIAVLAEEVL